MLVEAVKSLRSVVGENMHRGEIMFEINKIYQGSALEVLKTFPDECIDMVMTSPPYWALRDYGVPGQLGLEKSFKEYIQKLCDIFDEVKRVLKISGTCWVNMGDTYHNSKIWSNAKGKRRSTHNVTFREIGFRRPSQDLQERCLCQIPARFSIEMTARAWILRNEIIWRKPNCIPQSATNRFTVDFDKIYFFSKNTKYYFEQQFEPTTGNTHSGRKDGREGPKYRENSFNNRRESFKRTSAVVNKRNKRCVWDIPTGQNNCKHCATYPERLIETPIKAGCPSRGIVLDPFLGSGTTAVVAQKLGRGYVGIELNPEYIEIAENRLKQEILI